MQSTRMLSRFGRQMHGELQKRTCRAFSSSRMRGASEVRIVEVGPRDGLQNEKKSIPVATKIELVRRLAMTGLNTIEAGSFVSPKWVPQMANSSEILEEVLNNRPPSTQPITYQWLLPNMKGLENFFSTMGSRSQQASEPNAPKNSDKGPALNTSSYDANAMPSSTSGVDAMEQQQSTSAESSQDSRHEVSIFMAATESFSKRNTNCSVQESLDRFRPLISSAKSRDFGVRAYISVALGCPYEGPDVNPHKVAELAAALLEMGADEISVADTTGMGTAPRTQTLLRTLKEAGIQNSDIALHFHDTYGQALINTLIALEHGITTFDSAVGGLGGCPFSPGATGNVATEDLIHCLHSLGAETGVSLPEIARIGAWISEELGKSNESRAGKATLAKL